MFISYFITMSVPLSAFVIVSINNGMWQVQANIDEPVHICEQRLCP